MWGVSLSGWEGGSAYAKSRVTPASGLTQLEGSYNKEGHVWHLRKTMVAKLTGRTSDFKIGLSFLLETGSQAWPGT